MNMLIKNGTIIDGSRNSRYKADIGIYDNIITEIGELSEENYDKVIDAKGLIVAPGFIDTHSHSDLFILVDPRVKPKIMQGITTEILGQDGVSMAPLSKDYISAWRKNISGLDGNSEKINWNYINTEGYLNEVQSKKPCTNIAYLVPHGNIRMEAMGLDNRNPTSYELEKMKSIVRREIESGAIGISTGLIYIPCAYSKINELIELCKVCKEYDGIFVIHQRSEADDILESMEEVIKIGKESGVKVHFSHFKVCGKNNWSKLDKMIELLHKAESEGVRVSFDQYPYVAGSTMLSVVLPPWVHDGGTEKLLKRLEDTDIRKKIVYDIENGLADFDNFIDFAGFDNIIITSVKTEKNKDLIGKSLSEIAKIRNKNRYDAVFDLLYEEENCVGMVDFYGTEDHVKKLMKLDEMNLCTDGLLGDGEPHPRVYGAFPRLIGKYVREEKIISLEEAIYKMTGKAARTFKLEKRGIIKKGYYADLVIFNEETIKDTSDYINPKQYPEGIEYVLVNGKVAVENGIYSEVRNGKVIKTV